MILQSATEGKRIVVPGFSFLAAHIEWFFRKTSPLPPQTWVWMIIRPKKDTWEPIALDSEVQVVPFFDWQLCGRKIAACLMIDVQRCFMLLTFDAVTSYPEPFASFVAISGPLAVATVATVATHASSTH
ncbi:hypothetical protein E6O75_ATG00331 [Venturia nashicola]|uniref:Uncharacterized protein n=1 Tax=Venturia nashicola TaxID=86259 RepID=A0A4Z1PNG0_9PEZI|nr:hypothetical protein E6O75_ATG00331 [Venturia nashicola]